MTNKPEELKKSKLKASGHKMPKWRDCSWKRLPCGKEHCKICGPFGLLGTELLSQGKNPKALETVMRNLGQVIKGSLKTVNSLDKKPEIKKLKPGKLASGPCPEDFPLVAYVSSWRDSVFLLINQAYNFDKDWVGGEAVADLTWYANILCFKVFRQNLNRLGLKDKDRAAISEYKYTQSVLKTCLRILKRAIALVYVFDRERQECWRTLQLELSDLEQHLINI